MALDPRIEGLHRSADRGRRRQRAHMLGHLRRFQRAGRQPPTALMFREGELSNRHEAEQVIPLSGGEVQRVGPRVEVHGEMLQVGTLKEKSARVVGKRNGPTRNRTENLLIKSQLLCQLSYRPLTI